MPMYWDAYLADTTHLTCEEHGAYLLLLAAMWRRDGSVPNSDPDIARILHLGPAKWRRIKQRLSPFLNITENTITQQKLTKTWKKTQEKITKNKINGALGGRTNTKENKDIDKANGSVSVNPNVTIPEPEPEPIREEERLSSESPKKSDHEIAFEMWNIFAQKHSLSRAKKLTKSRIVKINARLKDCGGIKGWQSALSQIEKSKFLLGENDRGWTADLDFILRESSFTKLIEGAYTEKPTRKMNGISKNPALKLAEEMRQAREKPIPEQKRIENE